jgi:hypothetical protein
MNRRAFLAALAAVPLAAALPTPAVLLQPGDIFTIEGVPQRYVISSGAQWYQTEVVPVTLDEQFGVDFNWTEIERQQRADLAFVSGDRWQ